MWLSLFFHWRRRACQRNFREDRRLLRGSGWHRTPFPAYTFFLRRPETNRFPQFYETGFQQLFHPIQIGSCVHIAAEAEKDLPVIAENGAVDGHFTSHGNVGMP